MSIQVEVFHVNSIIISLPPVFNPKLRDDLPIKICNRSNTDLCVGLTVLESHQSTTIKWAEMFDVHYAYSEFNLVEKIKDKVHFYLCYRQKTTSDEWELVPKPMM